MTDYIAQDLQDVARHPARAMIALALTAAVMLSPCVICSAFFYMVK